MGKYQPFAEHLGRVTSDQLTLVMTFAQVAEIVDGLPPSAY